MVKFKEINYNLKGQYSIEYCPLFLDKKIKYLDIPLLIEKTMDAYTVKYEYTLEDLLEADAWAKDFAAKVVFE